MELHHIALSEHNLKACYVVRYRKKDSAFRRVLARLTQPYRPSYAYFVVNSASRTCASFSAGVLE